jgi:hypothetical protein
VNLDEEGKYTFVPTYTQVMSMLVQVPETSCQRGNIAIHINRDFSKPQLHPEMLSVHKLLSYGSISVDIPTV